jgi:hypothetical protein
MKSKNDRNHLRKVKNTTKKHRKKWRKGQMASKSLKLCRKRGGGRKLIKSQYGKMIVVNPKGGSDNSIKSLLPEKANEFGQGMLSKIPGTDKAQEMHRKMQDYRTKLRDKAMKMVGKTPFDMLFDNFKLSLFNIAALYVYFPSLMVNMPNSTLEDIIPEKDGCKFLFNDEYTCKRKIKCFFQKCSAMEDSVGYLLRERKKQALKRQYGGNNTNDENNNADNGSSSGKVNYDLTPKYTLSSLLLNGNSPTKRIQKRLTRKLAKSIARISYFPMDGANPEMDDRLRKTIMKDILLTHLDEVHIYKFLVLYRMLEQIHGDSIERELHLLRHMKDAKQANQHNLDSNHGIFDPIHKKEVVPFPFIHALLDDTDERITCLQAHLSGKGNAYNTDEVLQNCLGCKDCTLGKVSSQIVANIMEDITSMVNASLMTYVEELFSSFVLCFDFNTMTCEKFLKYMMLNFRTINNDPKIVTIPIDYDDETYSISDMLCGVPKMTFKEDVVNKDVQQMSKYMFAMFKSIDLDKILTYCFLEKMYLCNTSNQRLAKRDKQDMVYKIKENCQELWQVQHKYFGGVAKNDENIEPVLNRFKHMSLNLKELNLIKSRNNNGAETKTFGLFEDIVIEPSDKDENNTNNGNNEEKEREDTKLLMILQKNMETFDSYHYLFKGPYKHDKLLTSLAKKLNFTNNSKNNNETPSINYEAPKEPPMTYLRTKLNDLLGKTRYDMERQ